MPINEMSMTELNGWFELAVKPRLKQAASCNFNAEKKMIKKKHKKPDFLSMHLII